jgi:hypothetical protein
MSYRRLIAPLAAAAFAVPAIVHAETTTAPAKPEYVFTLGGDASYSFLTDLHDDGGSFSVFRSGSWVTMNNKIDESQSLRITLSGEYSHYFFRNIAAAPGSDGSDSLDVYQFELRPTYTKYLNDHFGVFAGVDIAAQGMSNADFADSLSYGVFAGVNYKLADGVWLGAGLAATTQLEDNPLVVPLLTVSWQATPELLIASEQLGFRATLQIDNGWSAYVRARYEFRQFRLDSDEVIADGVLTDQSVPVAIGVTYQPDDQLKLSGEVGVMAYRRLEFTESDGHQAGADEAEPTLFAGFEVTYSF